MLLGHQGQKAAVNAPIAIERASFAFAFLKGSCGPRLGVIAAVLFFYFRCARLSFR